MKEALVGYTGFVGSNICACHKFDALYNSKNITDAYGTCPDLLVFAGLRAEKYLANKDPDKDLEQIDIAESNIIKISPKKLVLISTVDVFKSPSGMDENSIIDTEGLNAYGFNRYQLELRIRERFPDALIIRLPGLFGKNIKKNFIYDFINVIPFMLKADKFMELSEKAPVLADYYEHQNNGFYRVNVKDDKREELKSIFLGLGFSALNFTDSRSRYQFYDLSCLWNDIKTALDADIRLLHPATEPVSAGELYKYLTGESFVNELPGTPADYDFRTIYAEMFGGKDGYIRNKAEVLEGIRRFVSCES